MTPNDDLSRLDALKDQARALDRKISDAVCACESLALAEGMTAPGGLRDYVSDLLSDLDYLRRELLAEMDRHGTTPRDIAENRRADELHNNPMRAS